MRVIRYWQTSQLNVPNTLATAATLSARAKPEPDTDRTCSLPCPVAERVAGRQEEVVVVVVVVVVAEEEEEQEEALGLRVQLLHQLTSSWDL